MSGHSKWSQIKRKKEAKDIQKGKIFSKISRLITIAVLEGGGATDPEKNVKLRLAIEKAKEANMPKENVKRAIEKGHGPGKENLKEVIYEGFGPEGTAFLIQATTDKSNRTFNEIKNILEKHGGKAAGQGAVSYLFKKCGTVSFDTKENAENEIFSFAENIGALDMEEDGDVITVYTPFENLGKIQDFLGDLKPYAAAEAYFKPQSYVKIENASKAKRILSLMESLEDLDDVQKVYANFDIPEPFLSI